MRKWVTTILLIAVFVAGIGFGHYYGERESRTKLEHVISDVVDRYAEETYYLALTNARACVLALDSAMLRFLTKPRTYQLNAFEERYMSCKEHWARAKDSLPSKDPETARALNMSMWEYEQWSHQIEFMLDTYYVVITSVNNGDINTAKQSSIILSRELDESRKYRDRIEHQLYEAWQ